MSSASSGSARPTARVVAPGYCRLTVVGGGSRVDVALPDAVPVAELLPDLAALLPVDAAGPLHVTRIDGTALANDRPLGDQRVLAGDVVCLVPGDPPPPPRVSDDVVTAIAETVDGRRDRWRTDTLAAVTQLAGLFIVATGVVPLLLGSATTGDAVVAGAVAAVLAGLVLGLGRSLPTATAAATTGCAALYAAVCGADAVAAGATGVASTASTFAGAGLGAFVAVALAVRTAPRAVAVTLLSGTATLAAAAAGLEFFGGRLIEAAAAEVFAWLWLTGLSDRLALRSERLSAPTGRSPALHGRQVDDVTARTQRALGTLTGLTVGAAIVIAAGLVLLAIADTTWAWAFTGTASLAAVLRARRFSRRPQVLALGGCAVAGLLALACRLVLGLGPQPALVAVFVAAGALLAVVGAVVPRADFGPSVSLAVDRFEVAVAVVLLPLLLGVFGVYGTVQGAAQNVH